MSASLVQGGPADAIQIDTVRITFQSSVLTTWATSMVVNEGGVLTTERATVERDGTIRMVEALFSPAPLAQVPIPAREQVQLFNSLPPARQQALIRELQRNLPAAQRQAVLQMLQQGGDRFAIQGAQPLLR